MMGKLTQGEFQTVVACIAKLAISWLHEGVVMKLNRGKDGETINDESARRFCRDVRSFLEDIENQLDATAHTPQDGGAT